MAPKELTSLKTEKPSMVEIEGIDCPLLGRDEGAKRRLEMGVYNSGRRDYARLFLLNRTRSLGIDLTRVQLLKAALMFVKYAMKLSNPGEEK